MRLKRIVGSRMREKEMEKIRIIIPMKLYFESFESSRELKEALEGRTNLLTEWTEIVRSSEKQCANNSKIPCEYPHLKIIIYNKIYN